MIFHRILLPMTSLVLVAAVSASAAVAPADKCEAARLKLAGKHASCMLKAEAVGLLKGVPADTAKCVYKFDTKCASISAKYGADCPAFGTCDDYRNASQCASTLLPYTCDTGGDSDGDGFTSDDCSPCDPLVNPGALELAGNGLDDDCDGSFDEVAPLCDSGLALDSLDAMDGARAIDLCEQTTVGDVTWGVLSARYVRGDGTVFNPGAQVGIQTAFSTDPVQGAPVLGSSYLALSSGYARTPSQPGACGGPSCASNSPVSTPAGFPQAIVGCPVLGSPQDDVALEVEIRVPTNVTSFRVRESFYAFDYPETLCSQYNDQFVTIVSPPPVGAPYGNVSIDGLGNPMGVNSPFLAVCAGCPLGIDGLAGTGFDVWDDAGATGWLRNTVPVVPGSVITVRFAIWDSGDQIFDSTVLLDGFEWSTEAVVAPTLAVE